MIFVIVSVDFGGRYNDMVGHQGSKGTGTRSVRSGKPQQSDQQQHRMTIPEGRTFVIKKVYLNYPSYKIFISILYFIIHIKTTQKLKLLVLAIRK